jgi:hypothetical protein
MSRVLTAAARASTRTGVIASRNRASMACSSWSRRYPTLCAQTAGPLVVANAQLVPTVPMDHVTLAPRGGCRHHARAADATAQEAREQVRGIGGPRLAPPGAVRAAAGPRSRRVGVAALGPRCRARGAAHRALTNGERKELEQWHEGDVLQRLGGRTAWPTR